MSEQQAVYDTQGDTAAEIHPPKIINVLRDGGLEEYKVWGWVKTSAKFIYHIKKLKGAKLAIWKVIALSIDKDGECKLSIHEIANMAGYSYSETQESIKELDAMNYLSINKESGKKSIYSPNFVARGDNQPTEYPSRKTRGQDDTPLQSTGGHPSSPALEKSVPSIKELKELIPETSFNQEIADIGWTLKAGKKVTQKQLYKRAEASDFDEGIEVELKRLRLNWIAFDEKAKETFRRFIRDLPAGQTLNQFVSWWMQDEWRSANPPWTLAVIMQRWLQAFGVQANNEIRSPQIGV